MATQETIRSEQRDYARRTLEGYGALCTINGQLLKLMEDADRRLLSVTAQWGETRGSGAAKDAIAGNIVAIHEAADRMAAVSAAYAERLDGILSLVEQVTAVDPLAGKVLAMRYMEPGRTPEFDEIAEELGYSYDHIQRKHAEGLDVACDVLTGNMTHYDV